VSKRNTVHCKDRISSYASSFKGDWLLVSIPSGPLDIIDDFDDYDTARARKEALGIDGYLIVPKWKYDDITKQQNTIVQRWERHRKRV
jgi:hypothetical protein|tara:strand:- start:383 stop:646 length:264 start_codon:yes stop_codon:yes gene_type:complete